MTFWPELMLVVSAVGTGLFLGLLYALSIRDRSRLPLEPWTFGSNQAPRSCLINDDQIYYWDLENKTRPDAAGKSNTLVLLHGIGAWSFTWRELAPYLIPHCRVLIVDLPGFGLSTKNRKRRYNLDEQSETMLEFLEKLQIQNPILVGSSMGGAIALWMAKIAPIKIRAVIALSPAINGLRHWFPFFVPYPILRFFSFVACRIFFRLIIKNVMSSHEKITEDLISEYWRPFAQDSESAVTFIKGLKIVFDPRLPYELEGISERTPVAVLWGAKDKMTPIRDHKLLSLYLPKAQFFTHPSAGHHIMEDEPRWCADHILNFLQFSDTSLDQSPNKSPKTRPD